MKGVSDRLRPDPHTVKMNQVNFSSLTKTVELSGDKGPLGIHVVPYCSSLSGRMLGLHIKGVEANSRSRRENIFREEESIVQINDTPLIDQTFAHSQEVFRQALGAPLIRLEVLPAYNKPRYEKSLIGQLFSTEAHNPAAPSSTLSPAPVLRAKTDPKHDTKLEARPPPDVRPKPTVPPAFLNPPPATAELQPGHGGTERTPSASPSPPAVSPPSSSETPRPGSQSPPVARRSPVAAGGLGGAPPLVAKKAGKRIKIDLKKGTEGLGFTVVTRDTTMHGPGPILVKNILQRGAAIKDGRLLPGDRILEVNGVDMTGRSQEELVAMLRSTKQGESVCVVVSRGPDDIFLPRELKEEDGVNVVLEDGREQLMYEIPLNDTGSAGLGLSLKGNKSRETGEDLGIFIKSIIHGGAAHKDGRLRANDQLTAVNGEALLGRSNHAAMETLRRSMSSEGNARGTIQLLLLRSGTQPGPGTVATPEPTESSSSYQPNLQGAPSPPAVTPQPQAELQEPVALPPPPPPQPPSPDYVYNQGPHGDAQGPPSHPSPDYVYDQGPHDDAQGPSHPSPDYMYQGPGGGDAPSSGPSHHPTSNGPGQFAHGSESAGPYATASTDGSLYGGGEEMETDEDFPPPPSPGAVAEMNREMPPHHREMDATSYMSEEGPADTHHVTRLMDNTPRNRASKSMDLVADESNMRSLAGHGAESPGWGALGPTLGLQKSSSLESLQTAVSEAHQNQADMPFHRPRAHIMVRGPRGCNQSFRAAIDRSYEPGVSEPDDDDDLSEQSSGRDTPASGSSRQELDDTTDDGKSKKSKTKKKNKKEKKTKGRKDADPDKKKRRGFALLRFGKKKEDKSKEATKTPQNKLEALNEEELDRNSEDAVRSEPRYAEVRSAADRRGSEPSPALAASLPDMEDLDDMDPNYARIDAFRRHPSPSRSPHAQLSRTPSPRTPGGGPSHSRQPSLEDLEGLYAKVNKPRPPAAAAPSHNAAPADSEQRVQALRREFPQSRAAPSYEELEAARRRVLDHDPHRMVPRGADSRPAPRYEDVERQYATHPRRAKPDEQPATSRSRPDRREPAPYPGGKPPGRVPAAAPPQPAAHHYPASPRTGQQQQRDRAVLRQDVPPPPSATAAHRGAPAYRHASPGRYISPERYQPGGRERYASPGRYISPERHPHHGGREQRYASPARHLSPERQPHPGARERYASPARHLSPERQQPGGGRAPHHHHHASPERYGYRDRRQPDPRHKNPMMGVV